jgi:hypothetical protein
MYYTDSRYINKQCRGVIKGMDFTRHETGAAQPARPAGQSGGVGAIGSVHKSVGKRLNTWTKLGFTALLFGTTILVVAIAALIGFSNTKGEAKYVATSKYQAVFINDGSSNGQSVYFGHISDLNSQYLVLSDVYYITTTTGGTTSASAANSNYSLTKLGCQQLHDPYDQMVINTSQVAFWENLNNSGKVVTAITTFQKDNPNGPNCSQSSSSVSAPNTTTQSTTNP